MDSEYASPMLDRRYRVWKDAVSTSPKGDDMSRKDYLALAEVIAYELQELRAGTGSSHTKHCKDILVMVAYGMCEVFHKDNANFDEDRFMGACGFNYIPPRDHMSLAARWCA